LGWSQAYKHLSKIRIRHRPFLPLNSADCRNFGASKRALAKVHAC
jgi:hypothetical protein